MSDDLIARLRYYASGNSILKEPVPIVLRDDLREAAARLEQTEKALREILVYQDSRPVADQVTHSVIEQYRDIARTALAGDGVDEDET